MKTFVRWLIPCAVLFAAMSTNAAEPLDIVGIRLGDPLSEATEKIKSHNSNFEIKTSETREPAFGTKPYALAAKTPFFVGDPFSSQPGEFIAVYVTLPPTPSVLWRIERTVKFAPGHEQVKTNLVAALREKYGTEVIYYDNGTFYWAWDAQGRPMTREQTVECREWIDSPRVAARPPRPGDAEFLGCEAATAAVVWINASDKNSQLVESFAVVIGDVGLYRRSMDARRVYIQDHKAKAAAEEVERAKQQEKPKL